MSRITSADEMAKVYTLEREIERKKNLRNITRTETEKAGKRILENKIRWLEFNWVEIRDNCRYMVTSSFGDIFITDDYFHACDEYDYLADSGAEKVAMFALHQHRTPRMIFQWLRESFDLNSIGTYESTN